MIKDKLKKTLPSGTVSFLKKVIRSANREKLQLKARKLWGNRKIVNLVILGVQKGGTTSLAHFLNHHPECVGTVPKESRFFSTYYDRGIHWYHSLFMNDPNKAKVAECFFEATPETVFYESNLRRLKEYNSDITGVLLLRDPVSRAYSAWNMWMAFRRENPEGIWRNYGERLSGEARENIRRILFSDEDISFEYWMKREITYLRNGNKDYGFPYFIQRGIYIDQIQRFWFLFSKEQLLIFETSELKDDRRCVLSAIEKKMNLTPFEWEDMNIENKHIRQYGEKINPDTKKELETFFKPYNDKLYDLIGVNYNW